MPGQRPTIPPISYKDINDTAYITQDTFMEGVSHISANDVIAPKDPIYGRYVPTAPLINSSNIFWNNAYLPTSGAYVNSTYELLWNIDQAMQHGSGGGGGQGDIPIDIDSITPNLIYSMVASIRALQAEVLRLRNSFICGIESYQETSTHMSNVIGHSYNDVEEAEPLWATDETELEWIDDANTNITQGSTAFSELPGQLDKEGSMTIADNADVGRITFTGEKKFGWTVPDESTLTTVDDAKIYMYLTLNNLNAKVVITKEGDPITLNLAEIFENCGRTQGEPDAKYNVLIIVSRAVKKTTGNNQGFKGNRFIWISFNDYYKDNLETFGYYYIDENDNKTKLSPTPKYLDNESISELEKDPLCFSTLTLWNNIIYKFDIYTKYQDFLTENDDATVEGSIPDDQTYKYKAAHIQIRSVSTYAVLETLAKQLVDNELVYCEANKKLYIIKNGIIINIGAGGGSSDDDTMTPEQINEYIIQFLINNDLIKYTYNESSGLNEADKDEFGHIIFNHPYDAATFWDNNKDMARNIVLNDIESINMINELGESYDIFIDNSGNIVVDKVDTAHTEQAILGSTFSNWAGSAIGNYIIKSGDDEHPIYSINKQFSGKRGFQAATYGVDNYNKSGDTKLKADRVKIASMYAPLKTDSVFGCSHGFIELENTSNKDFYLNGCYIYFYKQEGTTQEIHRLKLKGKIPANGTYLIRCKKYSDISQENTYIDVKTYDIEWYDKEYCIAVNGSSMINSSENYPKNKLIDLSMLSSGTYSMMLLFGSNYNIGITNETNDFLQQNAGNTYTFNTFVTKDDDIIVYKAGFIDSITFNNASSWVKASPQIFELGSNRIYKNMFELDPAKQAFNGLDSAMKDSSRYRLNGAPDLQLLDLGNEYITFPKTTDRIKYITDYTPKASYEEKNVITDKTSLIKDNPNAVSCFFGINPNKTRCFNWISQGVHNEYIWLRIKGQTEWFDPIESYSRSNIDTPAADSTKENNPTRKNFDFTKDVNGDFIKYNNVYYALKPANRYNIEQTTAGSHLHVGNKYIEIDNANRYNRTGEEGAYTYDKNESGSYLKVGNEYIEILQENIYKVTQNNIGAYLTIDTDIYIEITSDARYSKAAAKAFYADPVKERLYGNLPGNNVQFTSHKVIVNLYDHSYGTANDETQPVTWEYRVGRKKQFSDEPDESFISDIMEFTVYPKDWGTPIIYQTTDQQGFHWQEYQVWSATADKLCDMMDSAHDSHSNETYPVLINTGDAVQSGARINEWLDYYDGGKKLFKKYEQLNIVGNNDLCSSSNEWALGTGDDDGKSNSFFYHIFNCNEIADEDLNKLTVSKINYVDQDNPGLTRCIPSIYYVDFPVHDNNNSSNDYTFRLLMFNTEITRATCQTWYQTSYNIYTGWRLNGITITGKETIVYMDNDENTTFIPIYNTLYEWTSDADKRYILACHEMPFTVITNASLNDSNETIKKHFRSINGSGEGLVGCHCNQIDNNVKVYTSNEFEHPGMQWLSRLLEYRHIHLCIGGHKHTYAVTYPLVENFWWKSYNYAEITEENRYARTGEGTQDSPYVYTKDSNGLYLNVDNNYYEIRPYYRYNRIGEEGSYSYVNSSTGQYLIYYTGPWINSLNDNYTMPPTLGTDNISWSDHNNASNIINTSKQPYTLIDKIYTSGSTTYNGVVDDNGNWRYALTGKFLPGIPKSKDASCGNNTTLNNKHVIYFMCQASGYKLKSNKELPSNAQVYSFIIPKTNHKADGSDGPDAAQLYPMTSEIHINKDKTYTLYLLRYTSIFKADGKDSFTQQNYGTKKINIHKLTIGTITNAEDSDQRDKLKFGSWRTGATGSLYEPLLSDFEL